MRTWLFSDSSEIRGSRCRLYRAGICSGELAAVWWFRQVDGNQFSNVPPAGFVDLGSRCFGYGKSMDQNKAVLCGEHLGQVWQAVAPYVNSGMDHFEMGIERG